MTLPEPPDARGRDLFLCNRVEEQPLWRELFVNAREFFSPPKLPPLVLTSTPVPVSDRMATKTNPWAIGSAALVNGGLAVLAIVLGFRAVDHGPRFANPVNKFVVKDFPLLLPSRARAADGGSGGGMNDLIEANRGRNPKQDMHPLAPVQVPLLENPKLAIENRIAVPPDVKLPDNPEMVMIGVHESANVTLVSGGTGGPTGIGSGRNGGDGSGDGPWGSGPGSQGVFVPGRGGVTEPIPIFTPEAEFSDEARRQKHQGSCTISVIIDAQGHPQNPRVVQPVGFGLDEKALAAVMRYRFKPARKDGKPVAVRMAVVVDFRMF